MLKINYKNPFFVFGIISVLFFGYWLILDTKNNLSLEKGEGSLLKKKENQKPETNFNLSLKEKNTLKWVEDLNSFSDLKNLNSDFRVSEDKVSFESNSLNLTDLISQNLASEFISKVDFSQIKKSPQNFTKQIQSLNLDSFDLDRIIKGNSLGFVRDSKEVNESELKVIQDNSLESIKRYSREYAFNFSQLGLGFTNNDFNKFSDLLLNPEKPQNSNELKNIVSALRQTEEKFKNLPVPSNLIYFHKKTLAFLKNSQILLEAILNGERDPVRAYLAVRDGFSIISADINYLDKEFKKLSKQYNL